MPLAVSFLTDFQIAFGLLPRFLGGLAAPGGRHLDAGAPSLGKPDGNRLLGTAGPVLALAYMVNLFAHKFPRLGGRSFTLLAISHGSFNGLWFGHDVLLVQCSCGLNGRLRSV